MRPFDQLDLGFDSSKSSIDLFGFGLLTMPIDLPDFGFDFSSYCSSPFCKLGFIEFLVKLVIFLFPECFGFETVGFSAKQPDTGIQDRDVQLMPV